MVRVKSILIAVILITGCNHFFYYPSDREFMTPEDVELSYERISVPSGGETLHMWKIPAQTDARLGKVLQFHGNAQNISTHFLYAAWMAKFGFDVYVFDYRGYGRSTGKPDRAGLVADGIEVIRYVDRQPGSDFFILGQSLGGAVAVPAVILSGAAGSVRALVIDSSFYSYRALARRKLGDFWLTWLFQWPLGFLVSDELSPESYLQKISMPTLVVHGTGDRVVPYDMGKQLFGKLPGPAKEFWTLEGAAHTSFLSADSDWHSKLLGYLCARHTQPVACNGTVNGKKRAAGKPAAPSVY